MKNKVIVLILTISMITTLTACGGAVPTATAEAPANVDTVTETTEEKAETVAEVPCKDGHTWVEATCTEPKTCSVCGATEGEALGHEWLENTPNYQQAKTCSRCNETEGEPLEAEFEKKGISVVSDWDKGYSIITNCHDDKSKTTEGNIIFTNLKVVPSDEELGLKAADGYEWVIFDQVEKYEDENAIKYGLEYLLTGCMDYYDTYNVGNADLGTSYDGKTDIDTLDSFTVSFNGDDYSECKLLYGNPSGEMTQTGATLVLPFYIRIPVGYDGIIISNSGSSKAEKFHEVENAKVIDFIDDTSVNFRVIAK